MPGVEAGELVDHQVRRAGASFVGAQHGHEFVVCPSPSPMISPSSINNPDPLQPAVRAGSSCSPDRAALPDCADRWFRGRVGFRRRALRRPGQVWLDAESAMGTFMSGTLRREFRSGGRNGMPLIFLLSRRAVRLGARIWL